MSDCGGAPGFPCETSESLGSGTSLALFAFIFGLASSGVGASSISTTRDSPVLVSSGSGTSTMMDEKMSVLVSTGSGTSSLVGALSVVDNLLISSGAGSSSYLIIRDDQLESEGSGTSALTYQTDSTLVSSGFGTSTLHAAQNYVWDTSSTGTGNSTVFVGRIGTALLVSTGEGSSEIADTAAFLLSSFGQGASSVDFGPRTATLATTGSGISSVFVSAGPNLTSAGSGASSITYTVTYTDALESTGSGASSLLPVRTADLVLAASGAGSSTVFAGISTNPILTSVGTGTSSVEFNDPGRIAWVMNTETTATSIYGNAGYQSMAVVGGKLCAVGPTGFVILEGQDDDGLNVNAEVASGFADYGVPQLKRVEGAFFSYTSDGTLQVKADVYGYTGTGYEYGVELRAAAAPRTSRAVPGKGLVSRYWRWTVSNVDGADFKIFDASLDVAISTRRL